MSVYLTAAGLIVLGLAVRVPLLRVRGFDTDEFEHLHAAWCIREGMLPYRDFFEHHPPLFHSMLAPFLGLFDVNSAADDAIFFLFFARGLMWLVACLIVYLTFRLGRLWRNARVGCVAAVLLTGAWIFVHETLEVRPDVPALAFWLASLIALIRGSRSDAGSRAGPAWFGFGGLLLGLALLSTQKLLFAGPGIVLFFARYLFLPVPNVTKGTKTRNFVVCLAGLLAPVAVVVLLFALRDGLDDLFRFTVLWNLGWKVRVEPYDLLLEVLRRDPLLMVLGITGLLLGWLHLIRPRGAGAEDALLVPAATSLVVGLFLIPVPHEQYYLAFLPLLALAAAALLVEMVDRLTPGGGVRRRNAALAAGMLMLCVMPAANLREAFRSRNGSDLRRIRYVQENTSPADAVLDGWTGLGVFRPHACFYYFLHRQVRPMIPDSFRREFLEDLRSGRIRPRLVLFDPDLERFSPEITAYLKQEYEPTDLKPIWRRIREPDRSILQRPDQQVADPLDVVR